MNTDYVDEFENYDRKLIKLNSDTAILLHIFKKKPNHHFEDWMVLQDNEEYFKKECVPDYEDAARQFVKQFEGEECMAFVIALKNELENDKKNMALFDQGIVVDEITGTNWMRRYHSTKFDMAAFLKCFTKKTNLSKLITKKENAVNKKMTEHISDIARLNAEYYKNKSSFEERLHKLFD